MKKLISLLLMLALLFALAPVWTATGTANTEPLTVAEWNYGGGEGTSMPANGGEARWSAAVTCGIGSFQTSTGSIKTASWSNDAQYIQFTLCTTGFSDITHSSMVRSSGTGPKNFKVQYSLDGETFTDCGTFTVTSGTLTQDLDGLELPEAVDNQPIVYVRWVLANKTNFNGTADVASGGAFNMKGMAFSGTATDESLTVFASPADGDMALGSRVELSTETEGATIYYRSYSTEEGEQAPAFSTYDPAAGLVLSELPAAYLIYATHGTETGRTRLIEYGHYKVKSINASRYSGALEAGREITLDCETEGATILYTVTAKYGTENEAVRAETEYTAPISFLEADFPVHLSVRATKAGCIDSETLTLDYTLKEVGGERFYFGQLHTHTNISDGAGTLREAFTYAKDEAVDVDYLIVTDHSNYLDSKTELGTMDGVNRGVGLAEKNYVEGDPLYSEGITRWDYAKAVAASYTDDTFVGAYGYEMTWSGQYGHMNTFATDGFVSRNDPQYVITGGQGLKNYYELMTRYPTSIGMFNHPGETFGTFDDFAYYEPEYDAQVFMLEVGNGEGAVGGTMYWPSYEQYTRALDKGWHLAPSNSQDNHKGLWGDSNTCRTVIYTNNFTEMGLYAAIRDRRVIATEDSNCSALFTLNDELFGTILDARPETLHISVTVNDPDASDKSGKVSIIGNNGSVAAQKSYVLVNGEAVVEFDLDAVFDYYYARVDQSDGDICVTAPVWIDEVSNVGIRNIQAQNQTMAVGESNHFSFDIYNEELVDFNISDIMVGADYGGLGSVFYDEYSKVVAPGESLHLEFDFVPLYSGAVTINFEVLGTLGDKDIHLMTGKEYNVFKTEDILVVAVDAGHDNYYVSGGYAGYYNRLKDMVAIYNGQTKLLTDEITASSLAGVDLLVLSAPFVATGNNGKQYTEAEYAAIKAYADNGGSLLIAGKSGYGDNEATTTAATFNRLLNDIGTDTRLRCDDTRDADNTGSYAYQLKYKTTDAYALDNYLSAGVTADTCTFVYHNGSSVAPGVNAKAVVFGGENAYGYSGDTHTVEGTDTVYVTEETLSGGGKLFVTGCMFFNDYQLSNVDTYDGQTGNYHVINNMLRACTSVKTITEARHGEAGDYFMVRGTLVSNASGCSAETAYFDSVYIEDETGGICLFPVSGNYQVGQKVWAGGFVDSYQGDLELSEVTLFVDSNEVETVEPHRVKATIANAPDSQGQLLLVSGIVTDIKYSGTRIDYITVEDDTQTAIVFLDGYIGSNTTYTHEGIKVGSSIYAVGVATTGPLTGISDFVPRLRVRDAAEIGLCGDVNRDGEITAGDASAILRSIVKLDTLTHHQMLAADTNGNGIDSADAATILRYIVKLITSIG